MLKISCAGCLCLSPVIAVHVTLEYVSLPKSAKNSLEPPIFEVQGHWVPPESSLAVFVMPH